MVKLVIPATSGTAMIYNLYLSHRVQRTLIERLDFNLDDACGKSKDFLDSKELTIGYIIGFFAHFYLYRHSDTTVRDKTNTNYFVLIGNIKYLNYG